MRARIEQFVDRLRTGFWFLPSLMIVLATALALTLLWLDGKVDPGISSSLPWAYSGGPEGARSLLSTIAGSMITAASVTFSLASVALSIASQQYGSRVLRNFMRDRITQVLLGTFVSTFVHSVLVVRSIRGSEISGGFVPAISVTGSIALSIASLILLVYFIHHVSTSIQAAHIVLVIAEDLNDSIPVLYPNADGAEAEVRSMSHDVRGLPNHPISQEASGYLQSISLDALMDVACLHGAVIEILLKPGDHYIDGAHLAHVWGGTALTDEAHTQAVNAFVIGGQRTPLQDIRFQFQQLTDVIVRALSPGINDPFTAINGIDALASALCHLARRPRVPEVRHDSSGMLRLIVSTPNVEEILRDTVGHIALYATADPFVMQSLLRVTQVVEPHLIDDRERRIVLKLRADLDKLQSVAGSQDH